LERVVPSCPTHPVV